MPVHFVTVYMPCQPSEERQAVMNNLDWIFYRIFSKEPHSRVIVTGDFNKNDLSLAKMAKYGITPVLDPKTVTHIKGGHLD